MKKGIVELSVDDGLAERSVLTQLGAPWWRLMHRLQLEYKFSA